MVQFTRRFSMIAALILVLTAPMVMAQGRGGQRGEGGFGQGGQRGQRTFDPARMIERMDQNSDGVISKDEWRGPEEAFSEMDADGDGKLTTEEFTNRMEQMRGERGERGDRGEDQGRMRGFMLDRMKQRLGATDEEWTVLGPMVEKVQTLRSQVTGGRVEEGTFPESDALRKVVDDEASTSDAITTSLATYRKAVAKKKVELAAAQEELRQVVTVRQEAILVVSALLD